MQLGAPSSLGRERGHCFLLEPSYGKVMNQKLVSSIANNLGWMSFMPPSLVANFPSVRLIFGYKTSNPDCSRTHHNSWITTVLHWFSPFPSTLGCREAATCVQSCSFLQFGHKRQFGPLLGLSKRLPPLFGQHCPQFILLQNMWWKVLEFFCPCLFGE